MPYARRRRSYRPRRARRTRRSRTYRRKNYKRSTKASSSFKAVGLPRELNVKFPFFTSFPFGTGTTTNIHRRFIILGNSLNPVPTVLRSAASTLPIPAPTDTLSSLQDPLVPAHDEYSALYGRSKVSFSAFTCRFMNTSSQWLRVCLVPVPYSGDDAASLLARIAVLDAMTMDDICIQPYAKSRILGRDNANASLTVAMKRSTKVMTRVGQTRDNQEVLSQYLPIEAGDEANTLDGWFIYVRIFGTLSSQGVIVDVKGTIYSMLSERSPQTSDRPVEPPPPEIV